MAALSRSASSPLAWLTATLCALVLSLGTAMAETGVYLEGGTDDDQDDATRVGFAVAYDLPYQFFTEGDWFLGTYFEVSASYWDGKSGRSGQDSLFEGGVAGMLRYQYKPTYFAPFVEFGFGPHLMSESKFADRDFDIKFAFGSHLGAGLRLGSRGQYEVLYRFQHLSNADIGDSNPGINFHLVRVGYKF